MANVKVVDLKKTGGKEAADLPPSKTVLHVEYKDDDGHLYTGDLTVKRLTLDDIRRSSIRKAELNGGMPVESIDVAMRNINAMLAHLEVAVIKSPEWWKPADFYSADPLAEVYEGVMAFERSFRETLREQPQGAEGNSAKQEGQRTGHAQAVVDKEVPASANVG